MGDIHGVFIGNSSVFFECYVTIGNTLIDVDGY